METILELSKFNHVNIMMDLINILFMIGNLCQPQGLSECLNQNLRHRG